MNHFVFRVFGIVLVVVINSELGASVAYGGDCTSAACTDTTTNECISNQCECATTYFRNAASDACLIKVAIAGTCVAGEPAGQCSDANAECDSTALVCQCKTNYFVNKNNVCTAVVAALDGACDATDSATDQCAVTDSECRVDGTAKCMCKTTHYVASSACTIRKNPDETGCVDGGCVTHATCDTVASPTICECDAGYTASPTTTPTMCSGVVKFASLSYMYVVPILVSLMFLVR